MYHIDSKVDKPDISYMENKVKGLMATGVKLADVTKMYCYFISTQQEVADEITKNYGILNPNSAQQILRYLQGLQSMEVYDTCCIDNKWSSNKDCMSNLALLGYDIAKDILTYRKAKKYAESLKQMMDAADGKGFVHPTVSLSKTNRINYSGPALMNIPKQLLWNVIAPSKQGNVLFSADIKNQEPSIMINLLGIDQLKDALNNKNGLYETLFRKPFEAKTVLNVYVTLADKPRIVTSKEMAESATIPPVYYTPIKPAVDSTYYNGEQVKLIEVCNTVTNTNVAPILPENIVVETATGSVYDVPVKWDAIDEKKLKSQGIFSISGTLQDMDIRCEGIERKEFKTSWNAMTYGSGMFGIKKTCKHISGEAVYNYFAKIPEFKQYRKNCEKLANNGTQNIRTLFGTLLFANEYDAHRLTKVLMDLPIQGTGADILSMLMKHFDEETKARGIADKIWIYYSRHDELILEADGEWVAELGDEAVIDIIRDILEHQIDDWTPFKVEIDRVKKETLSIEDTGDEEDSE